MTDLTKKTKCTDSQRAVYPTVRSLTLSWRNGGSNPAERLVKAAGRVGTMCESAVEKVVKIGDVDKSDAEICCN